MLGLAGVAGLEAKHAILNFPKETKISNKIKVSQQLSSDPERITATATVN